MLFDDDFFQHFKIKVINFDDLAKLRTILDLDKFEDGILNFATLASLEYNKSNKIYIYIYIYIYIVTIFKNKVQKFMKVP